MNNVMLDLETMGNTPTAAIVAIGAVHFNATQIIDQFYTVVNLQSALDLGLTMDASTVLWWMKQSPAAKEDITQGCELPILTALESFAEWLPANPVIWGNGAAFDNVILASAYRLARMRQPWNYRNDRCYRTVTCQHINGPIKFKRTGTAHNALDDALNQAKHLQAIWASIDEPEGVTP